MASTTRSRWQAWESQDSGHQPVHPEGSEKRGALRLGSLFGIGIYIHATFWLLLVWVALAQLISGGLRAMTDGVLLILAVFGIVVLHELGHALTARQFGVKTRDITLYPIGGVASLERIPEKPAQELVVAVAGPAVNIALAAVIFIAMLLVQAPFTWGALALVGGPFLAKLFVVNFSIAVFNLLPAFPMDGGRVLRALLATRMDYARATRVAARLGQAIAFLFALAGLFVSPMLILIAFFVWLGAQQESALVQLKSALAGVRVQDVMIRDFRTLIPEDSLAHAVELAIAGSQRDFPVIEAAKPVGVLTHAELARGLAKPGMETSVARWMRRDFGTIGSNEMADTALGRLRDSDLGLLLVVDDEGMLIGMLSAESLGELARLKGALAATPRS